MTQYPVKHEEWKDSGSTNSTSRPGFGTFLYIYRVTHQIFYTIHFEFSCSCKQWWLILRCILSNKWNRFLKRNYLKMCIHAIINLNFMLYLNLNWIWIIFIYTILKKTCSLVECRLCTFMDLELMLLTQCPVDGHFLTCLISDWLVAVLSKFSSEQFCNMASDWLSAQPPANLKPYYKIAMS